MKKSLLAAATLSAFIGTAAYAHEGSIDGHKIPHLDHVIVLMMENHKEGEILGNPANAPFLNDYAAKVSLATNYWAVGHPSLTNYLELLGGSNFGITDDNWPVWVNGGCVDNNPAGSGCGGAYAALEGTGTDVANPLTVDPVTDPQIGPFPPGTVAVPNNWSIVAYPAAQYTAKTIAHQVVEHGGTWKSYQESLPGTGPRVDGVNYSDGTYSNLSPVSAWTWGTPAVNHTVTKLYAVKHNPFVYFKDVQLGTNPDLSFNQVVDFTGAHGLYADLARGTLPTLSFIAPNQCQDMHGAGGTTAQCGDDTHAIQMGDAAVKKLVHAIKSSPAWHEGRTALVILWDENDYDNAANKVAFLVDTNYGSGRVVSAHQYNHFSLTKTIEAALGLPCLNHACDASTEVMADLFAK